MKAKDKAEELFNKYFLLSESANDEKGNFFMSSLNKGIAKRCALISVNEIINESGKLNFEVLHTNYGEKLNQINGEIRSHYTAFAIYWNEVKKQIKNL